MAQYYKTIEGDRIDQIVLKYYGSLEMLEKVINDNPHLAKKSLSLEEGIEIFLDDIYIPIVEEIGIEKGIPLW